MSVIEINHITKNYGNGKGVFDVAFSVEQGEVMGFLGPNGAGKTTTIRQLMGFMKPDTGEVTINEMDCFRKAAQIQKNLGYLPGEIVFMDDMKGMEFLRFYARMKKVKDLARAKELIEFLELDTTGKIKKMSKGTRQKLGIICAFMSDPDILILDEPTSGLDPLMQSKFIQLILEEKEKGKTILMSSHIFEEIERTCDRAAIIRDGCIVTVEDVDKVRKKKKKEFTIQFANDQVAESFANAAKGAKRDRELVTVRVSGDIDRFIKTIASYPVKDMSIRTQTLEELFMHYYGGGQK